MSLLRAAREDSVAEVVAILTRLALRDTGQYLNPEESKALAIEKIGRRRTVANGPFLCRNKGDGQEGQIKPHIPRLLGR